MLSTNEIIKSLQLEKLLPEGGYFRQTYESEMMVGERTLSSAIYYLLTNDSFSALHRLRADEIYHFYDGSKTELFMISSDGVLERVVLGRDISRGERLQLVIPAGVWQGSRILRGEKCDWSLLGTTVTPGFDYADFELADRSKL